MPILSYQYVEQGSNLEYSYFSDTSFHMYFGVVLFVFVFLENSLQFTSICLEFQFLPRFTKLFFKMLLISSHTPLETFQAHIYIQASSQTFVHVF